VPPHTKVPNADTDATTRRLATAMDMPSTPPAPIGGFVARGLLLCLAPDQDQSSKGSEAIKSMHGPQETVDGTVADLAAVFNPLVDRFPEMEPNENARDAVLISRLGEAGV
jgi:hypothetical protein